MKLITRLIPVLLLALVPMVLTACPAETPEEPVRATILFFNDVHGHLEPFTERRDDGTRVEVGGMARMATVIRRIRREDHERGAKTFLLVAGDMLQGTPMSTMFRGRADLEVYEALGVDAMTVGNHEFDFGYETFTELRGGASFPFLTGNVVDRKTRKPICDASASFALGDGVELTVIGVTTKDLLTTTKPENVATLDVLPPAPIVEKEYAKGSERGPVVLLSHCKAATDEATARAVPGLLAIMGGHDQILMNPRKMVGPVPVFQAFEKGKHLGVLRIEATKTSAKITDWSYEEITSAIPEDGRVARLISKYREAVDANFKRRIGDAKTYLDGARARIRYEETNLGNFVTDVMREHTGAEIALLNAGSIRASIDEGEVTMEDVFTAMPYANELVTTELLGSELLEVLARACRSKKSEEDGGFLHVSGLRYVIRDFEPEQVVVGGAPLDPARSYRVAITDFLASGGDGYAMFKTRALTMSGSPLRELLVETFKSRGTVSAKKEGRITRVD